MCICFLGSIRYMRNSTYVNSVLMILKIIINTLELSFLSVTYRAANINTSVCLFPHMSAFARNIKGWVAAPFTGE